jgi:hypothetical protein
LRQGTATLALAAGMDLRTVQELLRHSRIMLTADTYTSVLPDVARTTAEKVAALTLRAGRLVPGTRRRRREGMRKRRRKCTRHGGGLLSPAPASAAYPAAPGRDRVAADAGR